ncbi:nudC domain-containing protein 3-like [Scleropages formosus]|uniref:NudC domain-containing protein 3 n=1 Tax=Scleropages formosus TaxID=113540 RepID=A0A0P7UIT0_SCLFO|nr:nudC domain-containing protein 3 [Scleropages formosus]KPP61152.1 nudC domain-containing protein 3-like [Scleropages formosus]
MSSPLEMTELYDNALLGILQHVGNIQSFLQVYFGFLYRKTDFYRLLSSPNDRMGFPPGVAEKMVLRTFKVFEHMAAQDRVREAEQREQETAPPAIQELEVESAKQEGEAVQEEEVQVAPTNPVTEQPQPSNPQPAHSDAAPASEQSAAEQGPEPADGASSQMQFQANPDSYNGAVRDNYTWSQDYTDVEVRVHVPASIVKGKQVSVSLQGNSVRVAVKEGLGERVLIEGELTHKINTENSLWSLEPGHCVLLSLNKSGEVWWSAVLKGETEIDVNQINRERSMATVDEEEHAVLDRLTFDYHQKLQGLPQSHEMKVHEMLKKGWDAEGSPFKGQKFDPTMFDIPPSAVQF